MFGNVSVSIMASLPVTVLLLALVSISSTANEQKEEDDTLVLLHVVCALRVEDNNY